MVPDRARRPLHFIASSLRDLRGVPVVVRGAFGRQLLDAQYGDTPASAKPLKGFGGASVLELMDLVRRRLQQAQRHYDEHDGRVETPKEGRNA